jgi:pantoate--beta-alanine ligase
MGFLHDGHLNLIKRSIKENKKTIVSIFVNPKQFGQNEDFNNYPRNVDHDLTMLAELKVAAVFLPKTEDIYPSDFDTTVAVDNVSKKYCGKTRPGHFNGVATIITKFLNIIKPDSLYLGIKDFQQLIIIEKMISDLNYSTKIVRCDIVREDDGLAMSSRNKYLHDQERINALCLYHSLVLAKQLVCDGITSIETIKEKMTDLIKRNEGQIDYIAFIDEKNFEDEKSVTKDTRVLLAVKVGRTRLIDNMKIMGNEE